MYYGAGYHDYKIINIVGIIVSDVEVETCMHTPCSQVLFIKQSNVCVCFYISM